MLGLPGGAWLGSPQPCAGVRSQGVEVHLLEAPVGLGVATVAAREAARATDEDPVAGTIHGAAELGWIDERFGQLQRMSEVCEPVAAEPPQIGGHDTTGKIGDGAWGAQHQHAGVIRDQVQARELLALPPADPEVAGTALEGARLPADQGQPAALVLGDIAQPPPGEAAEPQRVLLGHGGIPAASLVGPRQPHVHLLDRGRNDEFRLRARRAG